MKTTVHYYNIDTETERRKERWAISYSEFANPANLQGGDELIAMIADTQYDFIVLRNGTITNRWEDGTIGVPEDIKEEADSCETLYHPEHNEFTEKWVDVIVDKSGKFVKFV